MKSINDILESLDGKGGLRPIAERMQGIGLHPFQASRRTLQP